MFRFGQLPPFVWRATVVASLAIGLLGPAGWDRSATAQSALPETAAAAPESAVLFHELDLDREGEQWQQVEDLLGRVGVPNALGMFEEAILTEGSRQGDFTEADLNALLGGEMAIVVTQVAVDHFVAMMAMMEQMGDHGDSKAMHDMAGTPVAADAGMMATPMAEGAGLSTGVTAVLLPSDLDAAWAYVERQFGAVARDGKADVQEETYNGADLLLIEPNPSRERKEKKHHGDMGDMGDWMGGYPLDSRHGLAAARAGEFIVAGQTREDVAAIVDVVNGAAPSLASFAGAQDVRAQLPEEMISFTYLSGPAILDALDPELVEAWTSSLMAGSDPEASQGYAGVGISAEPIGFRIDSVMVPAEGSSFATTVPPNDPALFEAAERASADTFIFSAGTLPENSLAGVAYSIATAVNAAAAGGSGETRPFSDPPSAEEVQAELEQAAGILGFNPQTDLVDLIGDQFFMVASLPTIDMAGFGWDFLAAVSTTDSAALADTMQKVAAFVERSGEDLDVSTRQVDGDTVYVVGDSQSAEMPSLEIGVVADHVVVGSGSGIDEFGDAPGNNLAGNEQFQAVMGSLPSEGYEATYVDVGQLVDFFVTMSGMSASGPPDNDPACADYADQPAAQTALDEDPFANSQLDLDFDGQACEDAFGTTGTEASATASGGPENLRAFGTVAYNRDGIVGSSAILFIADPES